MKIPAPELSANENSAPELSANGNSAPELSTNETNNKAHLTYLSDVWFA